MYKDTQTQILGSRDPFELSEDELPTIEDEEEVQAMLFGDLTTKNIIQAVIKDGVSENSSEKEDVRKQKVDKFRKDSLKIQQAITRQHVRSDQVRQPQTILFEDCSDGSLKDLRKSGDSSIFRPVDPQDIVAHKMREQEA